MATFAFYNIGAANKEIVRLAARITELESAKPVDKSAALADALASNDEISKQLETAKTDLSAKTSAFDQLTTQHNALSSALDAACLAAKCEIPANATAVEKLGILTGAVSAAIAKTGVNIAVLPQASATTTPGASVSIMAQYNQIKDSNERTAFFRKHKAALIAEAANKL